MSGARSLTLFPLGGRDSVYLQSCWARLCVLLKLISGQRLYRLYAGSGGLDPLHWEMCSVRHRDYMSTVPRALFAPQS